MSRGAKHQLTDEERAEHRRESAKKWRAKNLEARQKYARDWRRARYAKDPAFREAIKVRQQDVDWPNRQARIVADPLLRSVVNADQRDHHRERQLRKGKRVIQYFRATFTLNGEIIGVEMIRALTINTALRQLHSKALYPEATGLSLEQV